MPQTIRPAAVAGMFYPDDPRALRAQVAQYLAQVGARGSASTAAGAAAPKIVLVPHAGYVYSGPVAAHAYAALGSVAARTRRVVLLGPTHRVAVRGIAAPTVDAFATPLGPVPVDRAAISSLADQPQVVANDAAHAAEHALEVQLPFLQSVLGEFTLVPLAVGHVTPEAVAQVLERLWGGDETLIVISSDLSHYLPYARARAIDGATVQRVLALDPRLHHDEACGATPLAGALIAAKAHGLEARLLDLRNSGDTAGDRSRVVGYAAVAFEPAAAATDRDDEAAADADPALGSALLARARNAIADALDLPTRAEPHHAALARPGATFVTLQQRGELRGCIGSLEPYRPLEHDVRANALAAAFRDPRFEPVAAQEVASLHIEVSLIGPAQPLAVRDEGEAHRRLRPHVDGVILEWRGRRATFLPQVWEQIGTPDAFLRALKRKAGLAADFWAGDLRLHRYEVRKFKETTFA